MYKFNYFYNDKLQRLITINNSNTTIYNKITNSYIKYQSINSPLKT